MSISTVVVGFRNYCDLTGCLSSLHAAKPSAEEIIVVDCASDPDQLAIMRQRFPHVTYIPSEKNLGYAAGNNLGIRAAHGDIVFLLNPDTVVKPDVFRFIEEAFDREPQLAAIQPQVRLFGTNLINNTGLIVQFLGFAWDRDYRQPAEKCQSPSYPAAFSGSAVFLRRQVLECAGGFDERYFMYHEDVDLSLRLRSAGYSILYLPTSVVEHKYQYKSSRQQYYLLERNRLMTVLKNFPIRAILLFSPAAIFFEFGLLCQSIRAGWWKEKIMAMAYVLRLLPSLARFRSHNRTSQKSPLFKGFQGAIEFGELQHTLLRFVANPILRLYWKAVQPWL